ncbi:Transposase DDE domain-containing protein [Sarcina sp. DSM 11001]|nr:Transposase DDE domain-containing protein [Sarcina sp. DSM 11001]
MQFRVLKFPIGEDSYEYIVTNLPKYAFPLQTLKELYNLRWNHEVAYRYLKYAGNMVPIHSLKREFLLQEIYAKLTLYNFSSFVASAVGDIKKKTEKYTYVLNHTQAQKNCIRFLNGRIEDTASMICRYLVPVRPGRKFKRNLRRQSADTLNYR